jgi:hypothetical protein
LRAISWENPAAILKIQQKSGVPRFYSGNGYLKSAWDRKEGLWIFRRYLFLFSEHNLVIADEAEVGLEILQGK